MTQAPLITVREIVAYEWPFQLRLPFRFGAVTHTHGRQAVVRARIRLSNGREGWGVAAESLAAKWFEKDPAFSDEENYAQLRKAIEIAVERYVAAGPNTAFGHYIDGYSAQLAEGTRARLNPLVAAFGPALIDRAVFDALLRLSGLSFYEGMRRNLAGMRVHSTIADLAGFDFDAFLGALQPAPSIAARHTVGLVDPITAADQAPGTRVEDGLPETLEEVAQAYRQRYWKLKVGGDVTADVDRLTRIASVLDRSAEPYHATLDGNEQYADPEAVLALWRRMQAVPALKRLCSSILFIEQPIKRAVALTRDVRMLAIAKPVIVDESDGELGAFPQATALGYTGISSKACKGFYKSFINLARCRMWNEDAKAGRYFMSAEDLTTLAGTCVQQDLVLVALLGLGHVERNGHHFVDGFTGRSSAEAEAFAAAHPDLYAPSPQGPRLRIEDGLLQIGSLACAGFGATVEPDFTALQRMPKAAWS
ncbi:mandelate racemase [Desertibaculum subflavum]|uniref:mandelate racemase n=1 Tax=Desertibaculum subflavum TaxID=2268458 RepID=UPI000E671137